MGILLSLRKKQVLTAGGDFGARAEGRQVSAPQCEEWVLRRQDEERPEKEGEGAQGDCAMSQSSWEKRGSAHGGERGCGRNECPPHRCAKQECHS